MTENNQFSLERERYELTAAAPYRFDLDRREFFKFLGAGVLVVSILKPAVKAQESGGAGQRRGDSLPKEMGAWLHLGEDGKVTAYTGKVEMGQNIRTSLSQAVAEELRVPIESIGMVMGDTQLTPFDMGTFGSRTTPTMNPQLRKVAAAAREMLIGLAAAQWQVDRQRLIAANAKITDPATNRSVDYTALTKGQQLGQTVTDEQPLIPAANWRVAGQSALKVDGRDFVTGKHRYPSDQKMPGTLYGKVLRPPSFGATLVSVNTQKAEQLGSTVVHDGNFVGTAAASTELAAAAIAAIEAEWKFEPQISSKDLFPYLRKSGGEGKDPSGDGDRFDVGNVDQALGSADHRLQQSYTVSYIAHTPLEPRAALAKWEGDNLTVWTGTQRPFGVRGQLAQAFRIPEDHVRVLMPDTGSGYGGKHTGETAIEAARLARAARRPVKVVWTREEEFTWAYFRPAGVIEAEASLDEKNAMTSWYFININSGPSGVESPYRTGKQLSRSIASTPPLRHGSYRALAATANHFARESFMDELASAAGIDPLEFRLAHLENPRLRAVLETAAKRFNWTERVKKKTPGTGLGLACGTEKGSFVAACVQIDIDPQNKIKVRNVTQVFECGPILNADNLLKQVQGAIIMGLGPALREEMRFENGQMQNASFRKYQVPRFDDVPELDIHLLERNDLAPAGAGETPIIAVAPAIANAVFHATGKRVRRMPIRLAEEGKA